MLIYKRITFQKGWFLIFHSFFLEAVLTQFEKKGYEVIRNKRYTGDGGIDGMIKNKDGIFLVQTKRYSGRIHKKHVLDFHQVIQNKNAAGGFFVHTGKTSKPIFEQAKKMGVSIISGQSLINLFKISL